jgi:hypothetical protein
MALSVAEICDSIAQNPEFEQRTRLFVGEFPIYSARFCGQTGFPNQLMSDSRLFFEESSSVSWVDERC